MKKKIIWGILAGVIVAFAAWGPMVSNSVEQAKYSVVEKTGNIEIRDYAPMIVAQASVSGERKEAINKGFRIIADYIFGNNTLKQEVAMTAPVIQQKNAEIAMTAPVIQTGEGNDWKVRFVMPANYTMETLPKPNNDKVKLLEVAGKRMATITFSGVGNNEKLAEKTAELEAFLEKNKLKATSAATYAFFNPPWTLPFFRRNEVMIEVAPAKP